MWPKNLILFLYYVYSVNIYIICRKLLLWYSNLRISLFFWIYNMDFYIMIYIFENFFFSFSVFWIFRPNNAFLVKNTLKDNIVWNTILHRDVKVECDLEKKILDYSVHQTKMGAPNREFHDFSEFTVKKFRYKIKKNRDFTEKYWWIFKFLSFRDST